MAAFEDEKPIQPTNEPVAESQASAVPDLGPDEVDWDGPEDPENPYNWSMWKKSRIFAIIMALNLCTNTTSSCIAPAVPALFKEFNASPTGVLGTLVVTIELMGTAVGPLLLAPLSELYGRRVVYNIANLVYCCFTVGCARAPSILSLTALRFLQGCAASGAVNNAGGTIGDIIRVEKRGAAMSVYTVSTLIGPIIGPILGSYLAASAGWRWVFWLLLIMIGTFGILCALFCSETYEPVLLRRKAALLRKTTDNPRLHAKGQGKIQASGLFGRAIGRPIKMLCLCPLITGLALYVSVFYGFIYLLFSTFSRVFQDQYHYSDANLGLSYLGLAAGMLLGLSATGVLLDRTYMRLKKKSGEGKPEYRLEALIYGALASPIGYFIYGWTAEKHIFSAVPIIATAFVGFGILLTLIPIQVYMIDAYPKYAASAIAASSLLRSIAGGLIPLAGNPLFDKLGLGLGSSVLGICTLSLAVVPWFFCRVGEGWRKKFSPNFD